MTRRRPRTAKRRAGAISPALIVGAVLLLSVVLVLALVRPNPSRPLRPVILTSAEWEPFVGPSLDDQGPLARVVTDVFRAAGYAPQVEFTSWTAAQQRVVSGEALGTFPFIMSEERKETYIASDQIAEFTYVLFARADGDTIDDASDLSGLRVAGVDGYDYWPEIDEAVGDYVTYPTSGVALRALAEGRVDVVVEGDAVGQAIIESPEFPHDAGEIIVVQGDQPWQSSTRGLHLLLPRSAENERLIAAFNEQFRQYAETDTYERLIAALEEPHDVGTLTSAEGSVWLLDEGGEREVRTPNRTAVTVLAWPDTLDEDAPAQELVSVRVTSGPWAGRNAHVDLKDIEVAG